MKKVLFTLIFALAGTNAFAMTFDVGDDKIDLYASVRAYAAFNHTARDKDSGAVGSPCPRPAGESCSQIPLRLQTNSRVGVKWTHDDFFVNSEFGIDAYNSITPVTLRLLYGDYKFAGGDKGRIRIGQIPSISNTQGYYNRKLNSDNGLNGFGTVNEQRRVGVNYEIGGFSVSLLSMRQDASRVVDNTKFDIIRTRPNPDFDPDYADDPEYNVSPTITVTTASTPVFRELMPRIEAAYSFSDFKVAGSFVRGTAWGGVDYADSANPPAKKRDYGVSAGHVMVAANPKITDDIRLIASGFYSLNGSVYNMVTIGGEYDEFEAVKNSSGTAKATPLYAVKEDNGKYTLDVSNTSVYGGAVALAVKAFEVGFGIQSAGNDQWWENKTGMTIYANYQYRISNFRITPEFAYIHSGNMVARKVGDAEKPKITEDVRGFQLGVQFRFDI